jgi:hypothetical protein
VQTGLPVSGTGMRTGMTARATAARPGVPGCGAASTVASCRARIGRHCGRGLRSAAARLAPVRAVLYWACVALSKRPGSLSLGFGLSHALDDKLLRDKQTVNVRAYLSRIAAWYVDKFEFPPHAQGVYNDLPARSSVMGAAGGRDPQHFHRVRTGSGPLCTRHPHVCAHKACCCAVASKICGRPIRPCGHCSCDGAAPSLAGEYTDGLA